MCVDLIDLIQFDRNIRYLAVRPVMHVRILIGMIFGSFLHLYLIIYSMHIKQTRMQCSSSFILKNCGKILAEPMLEKLPNLFVSYFVRLIKVGNHVPRMEYYMSGGKCDKFLKA